MENKDSSALLAKLKEIGFEQTNFEPMTQNRFIVSLEGIPSYIIKAVSLPSYNLRGWVNGVSLTLYNPVGEQIETKALDQVNKDEVTINIKYLTPTGDIDTEWEIVGSNGEVTFGNLDWSNEGEPNMIWLKFEVKNVLIKYPAQ